MIITVTLNSHTYLSDRFFLVVNVVAAVTTTTAVNLRSQVRSRLKNLGKSL